MLFKRLIDIDATPTAIIREGEKDPSSLCTPNNIVNYI